LLVHFIVGRFERRNSLLVEFFRWTICISERSHRVWVSSLQWRSSRRGRRHRARLHYCGNSSIVGTVNIDSHVKKFKQKLQPCTEQEEDLWLMFRNSKRTRRVSSWCWETINEWLCRLRCGCVRCTAKQATTVWIGELDIL
jgi:hypothetical protein